VFFINEKANLSIESGAALHAGNGMLFSGNDGNSVQVSGTINDLYNVTFKNNPHYNNTNMFDGLYLNNQNSNVSLYGCTFQETGLHSQVNNLNINPLSAPSYSCTFTDCYSYSSGDNNSLGVSIEAHQGNVNIGQSYFYNSPLELSNDLYPSSTYTVTVTNCQFSGNVAGVELDLSYMNYFTISNNIYTSLQPYDVNALGLYYCGKGQFANPKLLYNSSFGVKKSNNAGIDIC
jgi:hypothetical protein